MKVNIDDIKVSERLRKLDNSKVAELVDSIKQIGLLQPIVVDTDNNLLSGLHRLEAFKSIGYENIDCKVVNLSEQKNRLVEIDENLCRLDLNYIERAEHLIHRDEILISLGQRAQVGDNQHTGSPRSQTTQSLAKDLGISRSKYYEIKSVYKIEAGVREILKKTDVANNLDALMLIQKQTAEIQSEVAKRITDGCNLRELIGNIHNEIVGVNNLQRLNGKEMVENQRQTEDFYPTHPAITQMLLEREELEGTIWEPACGRGDMSQVLIDRGYDVLSTDLIDRGYGEGGIDFLDDAQISRFGSVDNIITNPPFKLGTDFVLQAKKIARRKICIFNRTSFLEGVGRYDMWIDKEFPLKNMYQFSSRVSFSKNEVNDQSYNGTVSFSWFVFEKGYVGKPTIDWIPPIRIPKPNKK